MSTRGTVLLGVSGGIAAYKAAEILRGFQQADCDVRVILTRTAARFVTPLTFAALSGHAVACGRVRGPADARMDHVELTRDAALFVVAPATANTIARLALGLADDWLGTHALACQAPLLLAPAMNQRMWTHPAVQAHLTTLVARGAAVVPPGEGELACGEVGPGRMAEPEVVVAAGLALLAAGTDARWRGRRVLVTSGPTCEDVDLVRFVGNRSSGRMGHAIATAAARRGAEVVLVSGPTGQPDPNGCRVVRVRSADDMALAVAGELPGCAAAFFAAAVADFRPVTCDPDKMRREGRESVTLELVRTRDVLGEAVRASSGALLVGFAAEPGDVLVAGRDKLARKGCDVLVANRIGGEESAFDAADNEVHILFRDGREVHVTRAPKAAVAARLLDEVAPLLPTPGGVS